MPDLRLAGQAADRGANHRWRAQVHYAWGAYLHQLRWDHLATLTFRYLVSKEAAIRELHQQWLRGLAFAARRPIPCFCALERAGGGLHWHVLTAGTAGLCVDEIQHAWRAGISKIEVYDAAQGGAWYVTKGLLARCEWYDVSRRRPPLLNQSCQLISQNSGAPFDWQRAV